MTREGRFLMQTGGTLGVRRRLRGLLLAVALTNAGCSAVAAGVVGGVAGGATYSMLSSKEDAAPAGDVHVVPVGGYEVGPALGPCVGTASPGGR
jgi:hypothetical protein